MCKCHVSYENKNLWPFWDGFFFNRNRNVFNFNY